MQAWSDEMKGEEVSPAEISHNLYFPWYSPMSNFSHREPSPCNTASCSLKASVWLYTGPALALAGAWLRRELVSLGRTSLENLCLRKSPHRSARVHSTWWRNISYWRVRARTGLGGAQQPSPARGMRQSFCLDNCFAVESKVTTPGRVSHNEQKANARRRGCDLHPAPQCHTADLRGLPRSRQHRNSTSECEVLLRIAEAASDGRGH